VIVGSLQRLARAVQRQASKRSPHLLRLERYRSTFGNIVRCFIIIGDIAELSGNLRRISVRKRNICRILSEI
jgi:hypothetical protein